MNAWLNQRESTGANDVLTICVALIPCADDHPICAVYDQPNRRRASTRQPERNAFRDFFNLRPVPGHVDLRVHAEPVGANGCGRNRDLEAAVAQITRVLGDELKTGGRWN